MVFEKLQQLLAEEFSIEPEEITMETSFMDDLEADSLDLVEMMMALEDEFGIDPITEEEAATLKTVGDVVAPINSKS
ncbi:MAG: acyl carrier protein [Butyricicoccus sp.]|nr:acyl carrier protein [Butyricicoccus sp.]